MGFEKEKDGHAGELYAYAEEQKKEQFVMIHAYSIQKRRGYQKDL